MKPVSVKFQCFGPYMDQQYIDFSALERSGLFLICGETGAGKTTILDAICYALYGKSSGGLRGDISVMRCALAGKNDETRVEFVFDSGGQRYKFIRSLKYGRKNLNDSHNCMIFKDGVYVPIFENPKATFVNQKAQELIGLTYDQFRQVIILPQGQFERLLVSDSAEKEKILVSLFHADRWQKIAEELYSRVMAKDDALRLERQSITLKLKEYDCESLEALAEKSRQIRQELDELRQRTAIEEAALAELRQRQEAALLENQEFERLRLCKQRLEKLLPLTRKYEAEQLLLAQADQAERIRPEYMAYREAKTRVLRERGRLEQTQKAKELAVTALAVAEENLQRHDKARSEYECGKRQITVLEQARGLYEALAQMGEAAELADRLLKIKDDAKKKADEAFARREQVWQEALAAQRGAIEAYQQAQQVYLRGIGSALARKLVAGEPCPVCGSLEHPAPAQPIQGHMTDAQLERYNQAMNRANEAVSQTMQARAQAERSRDQAGAEYHEAARTAALARQELSAALDRKVPGVDSQEQLERKIQILRKQTADFEAEDVRVKNALNESRSNLQAARAAVEAGQKELIAAEAAYTAQQALWQQALESSGLESEEAYDAALLEPAQRQQRAEAVIRFQTELAGAKEELQRQQEALDGRSEPNLEKLKQLLAHQEQICANAGRHMAVLEQKFQTMQADHEALTGREEILFRQRVAVDEDLEFANRLRGRSGISLQRYVLGVMLTSITVEANRLLENVYGGRYRLYRTDEIAGSGHKGGLELEVFDAANAERRSVTTLSGGEKFLVALSLAIGLSTVVQAQGGGIRLEAMFIDEGFGSLDRESVHDALEVLQGIQRSAGVVGIISHVQQLAEIIPTKIEIVKGRNGSRCRGDFGI